MSAYSYLRPFEQQIINEDILADRISNNHIVLLKGKRAPVLVGEGLSLKVNSSLGLNSLEGFNVERDKVEAIRTHKIHPDTMMDLSTVRVKNPLYELIADEIGCPVGTVPYYVCFNSTNGIDKNELLETIEQQASDGVSFMTLHPTADLRLSEQAMSRHIPIISRGGSLLLRDMKKNRRQENIVLSCLNDIIGICKKNNIVVNVGTTFRPSTLYDALDNVNRTEIEMQKRFCKVLIDSGIHVQMEGLGHIPFLRIPEYVDCLRKEMYVPFMPLGPIVSDRTQGQDHITASIGACYLAALGGADIINAVTREEHTGGIPHVDSIIEAIDAANTVSTIIDGVRFMGFHAFSGKKYQNCMGDPQVTGCSRCGQECPFLWNDENT